MTDGEETTRQEEFALLADSMEPEDWDPGPSWHTFDGDNCIDCGQARGFAMFCPGPPPDPDRKMGEWDG